jgi:nucleoside-diphosphate-sugar epimerase
MQSLLTIRVRWAWQLRILAGIVRCDAVVANAALYSVTNARWKDNIEANKLGTENVYEALAAVGVKRAVHISTFGVYGWFPLPKAFNESSACRRLFRRSKRIATRAQADRGGAPLSAYAHGALAGSAW